MLPHQLQPRQSQSPRLRGSEEGGLPAPVAPVAQLRSHRLEPITLQPRTPRLPPGAPPPPGAPAPAPRAASQGPRGAPAGARGASRAPPALLAGIGHAAAAVRGMDWAGLFGVLDAVVRYFVPCEALTLYVAEEQGRYLRKVNTYLEAFPPSRRGRALEAVAETTMEGFAAINAEPCTLPSQTRFAADWASREAGTLIPLPGAPTLDDVMAGTLSRWMPKDLGNDGSGEESMPAVKKVHNVLAWPLRFGMPCDDPGDPFFDYSSVDSAMVGVDESVFGVIKLTNRIAEKPRGRKLQIRRLQRQGAKHGHKDDLRYKPFGHSDCDFLAALSRLLRELYITVDPVTFGPRVERPLGSEAEDDDPLNAPSLLNRSALSRSLPPASRMLEQGAAAGGMFGVLGGAFAKTAAQRRRAAELPDVVARPRLTVTSDSAEATRGAPGWVHREWPEEEGEEVEEGEGAGQGPGARRAAARAPRGQGRVGGISLLATWCLVEEAILDAYTVICRFQLRVRRTSRARQGHQSIWHELPPFFCISPDEATQSYCSFLTDHLVYGEEYVVSVRAGSADRWSEWSAASDPVLLVAPSLRPQDGSRHLGCKVLLMENDDRSDPFETKDHRLHFSWPAFVSFDPRTPLPVEYCIEAWQRKDDFGAAAADEIRDLEQSAEHVAVGPSLQASKDWRDPCLLTVAIHTSNATQGQPTECYADVRRTPLVPGSVVYFSVRARYVSLPGTAKWSGDALFTSHPVHIPEVVPSLPEPSALSAGSMDLPEALLDVAPTRTPAGGTAVVRWPFPHPAKFCPGTGAVDGAWSKGPFTPVAPPDRFPLPFRIQFRALRARGKDAASPSWSEWREAGAHQFVRRCIPAKQPSQREVELGISRGQLASSPREAVPAEHGEGAPAGEPAECLDPQADPLGVRNEDWALHVSALGIPGSGIISGLVQLRWISCRVEANTSAASRVLCTHIAAPSDAPDVEHLVVNCSSGSVRGLHATGPFELGGEEDVVHELRHVARLTWQLPRQAPSLPFITMFVIRYKEVPPGSTLGDVPWIELEPTAITAVQDHSISNAGSDAKFVFELADTPLLRYHTYYFCVQSRSPEHASTWSSMSEPLAVMLPALLPPGPAVDFRASRAIDGTFDESNAGSRTASGVAPEDAEELAAVARVPHSLDATVHCADHRDASSWHVALRWRSFLLADAGAERFPGLASLPVEFQVSYHVTSRRPATNEAHTAAVHEATHYTGRACPGGEAETLRQRRAAHVCLEGWIGPGEALVERSVPRHRLPPLRCDVRLFVACRCPAVTGPQWSEEALLVDLALPRQAQLPLPVPRQLSCVELQARGLQMDFGMPGSDGRSREGLAADGYWAVLCIPAFPVEFVITGPDLAAAGQDLLHLDSNESASSAHYVIQYRSHCTGFPQGGASARAFHDESEWRVVPTVKRLIDAGEDSVYVVSGLVCAGGTTNPAPRSAMWATFRLASRELSHFGYASPAVCVSVLSQPSKPELSLSWLDSPSLDGIRVQVAARCSFLSLTYQLRYRQSGTDARDDEAWTVCEVNVLKTHTDGSGDVWIQACAPVHGLAYHSEYIFSLRTASHVRFSPWSQDSNPVRLSLEHHGMQPLPESEGKKGIAVQLLGCEERHNYRCPVADVSWPLLTFPTGVWGRDSVSPSPELTIEYRLRWRRRIRPHNHQVALHAAMEELGEQSRPARPRGGRVLVMVPDPDSGHVDTAGRGYSGDGTKLSDLSSEFTPWQTSAVIPAKASARATTTRCAFAMAFLQECGEYEVAVDWRWRRVGDAFWMPAYEPTQFSTAVSTAPPPSPCPVSIPPEVWDGNPDLQALGLRHFALFTWPFVQPPTSGLLLAPVGKMLSKEAQLHPLAYGDYAVQFRRLLSQSDAESATACWTTCPAHFLLIHGKPLCLVSDLSGADAAAPLRGGAEDEPRPVDTPALAPGSMGEDELEFRVVRTGDCETSAGLACAVAPPLPPAELRCRIKLLPPHSTLVLSVRFREPRALGRASAPREYQLRVSGPGGVQLLAPVRLPLERTPEAFEGLRAHGAFLGGAGPPARAGAEFAAARGGGEAPLLLEPREFEHLLSCRELAYGGRYAVSVRWISPWRVSTWAPPVEVALELPAPAPGLPAALELQRVEPLEMPRDLAGAEFEPPVLGDAVDVSWAPFSVSTWGGGCMEYQVQRRCMVRELGREDGPGLEAGVREAVLDGTPWEAVGVVSAAIDDPTGRGVDHETLQDTSAGPRLHFKAEDLKLSARYQFRLRARLLFNPSSGHSGEWSEYIYSEWHRTMPIMPDPTPPAEAAVPDIPPAPLLAQGTALISFGRLPMREAQRPSDASHPPAPYTLQFRGAEEPHDSAWHVINSTPLGNEGYIVADQQLHAHIPHGVVFRLWRCTPDPEVAGLHKSEDDERVRYFSGLVSKPSAPVSVQCPCFLEPPTCALCFGLVQPYTPDGHLSPEPLIPVASGVDPSIAPPAVTPPLTLRLSWSVDVPANPGLMPIELHQIRFRRLSRKPPNDDVAAGSPGARKMETPDDCPEWQTMEPFRHAAARDRPAVTRDLLASPSRFPLGADYELAVRVGTHLRWGAWSPPVSVSLAVQPPALPLHGGLSVETLTLRDETVFFKLTWPTFSPHPLCSVIEYRICMMRVTKYRWSDRLSAEMAERSAESLAAQQEFHVVGRLRCSALRPAAAGGACDESEGAGDRLEFVHNVAADPECAYQFAVDAKHERCDEVDPPRAGEQWSARLVSREVLTPPLAKNRFVPTQVPLEASPLGRDRERVRAPFPLALGDLTCERCGLSDPERPLLLVFAPWRSSSEALRWPHRIEYSPYIPRMNANRLPIPGDEDENGVEWHLPARVEYLLEDADASGSSEQLTVMALIEGFNEDLWSQEQARLGIHRQRSRSLGSFARVRVVREGGPEGLQMFSSPSVPMRLHMPPVECAPSVATWCAFGRPHAVLWWPCTAALAAEDDKGLDMSTHVQQVRMRRPLYEPDGGWIEGPVKRTPAPVLLVVESGGRSELHAFDCCNLLDDSIMPQSLSSSALPSEPTGAMPDPAALTFEFSVRVSDGFRWSNWSKPSEACNFAMEPTICDEAPVSVRDLAKELEPMHSTVCAAQQLDPRIEPLSRQLRYTADGDMEPPQWVSVVRAEESDSSIGNPSREDSTAHSKMTQYAVTWPNLPPHAYCQPAPQHLPILEELIETGDIPPYVPPPISYRVNVWLDGSAHDAAPIAEPPQSLLPRESPMAMHGILYRQVDVPVSSFPEPDDEDTGVPSPQKLSLVLPCLPPDRRFHCTVEARFQTLTSVEWWTPLMRSGEWTVERVPPPPPPVTLPICELPTPEYQKLAERIALGASGFVAVRWPWSVDGSPLDAIREASHALEFCPSESRPLLQDPSSCSRHSFNETAQNRPVGPWKEPKAVQLYFVHFETGQVLHELPVQAQYESNWEAVLVGSGFAAEQRAGSDEGQRDGKAEASFVHLRWRYRASARELAVTPTPLHFSAAAGPVRVKVAGPAVGPQWGLDCPARKSRIGAWLRWVAWSGAVKHQLSFRILQKPRRRRNRRRLKRPDRGARGDTPETSGASESEGTAAEAVHGVSPCPTPTLPDMTAAGTPPGTSGSLDSGPVYEPVTGWIEMAPAVESIERKELVDADDGAGEAAGSTGAGGGRAPEDRLCSEYSRRLPPQEWNSMLFRHYRNQDEFFNARQAGGGHVDAESAVSSRTDLSRASGSKAEQTEPLSVASPAASHRASSRRSRRPQEAQQFRMSWGMLVEWRVRVSDGVAWSQWSPPSAPGGLVPAMPSFPTPINISFSRREPTIAKVSWGMCTLPPDHEHLARTIEYVLYLTSDEDTAKSVLQAGQGNFSTERLHAKGIDMSEGSCGVLSAYTGEDSGGDVVRRCFNLDDLFSEASACRLIGKFSQSDAKWINFAEGGDPTPVTGFELTVSGLKPETVHRLSVRARCSTAGLDEIDWQRLKHDPAHPLRWSEPQHSAPILTPRMPPPLLVPLPLTIPDGRFARFRHTPCILVSCPLFKKAHRDDFDKDHPVVLDIKPAGALDEDFREVPLEHSTYCHLEPHGPCRLIYNLPHLHAELRTRNTSMNYVSAACPPVFAVPPLLLDESDGPSAELHLADDGNLFVRLLWQVRCLPHQGVNLVQLSIKKHRVEAAPRDLEPFEFTPAMVLERIPANAVMAAGEAYEAAVAEADSRQESPSSTSERCPLLCRRCYRALGYEAPCPSQLGPWGRARLEDARRALDVGAIRVDDAPPFLSWQDNLRLLRVPHKAEEDAREREEEQLRQRGPGRRADACQCSDFVLQRLLPVDGDEIHHGVTYRFRIRVKDELSWSPWTEFSTPVHVTVPPPRPALIQRDLQNPAPPPSIEVQLMRGSAQVDAAVMDLADAARRADVRLRLSWLRFDGRMKEVEYRVLLWTLSPEQKHRTSGKRAADGKGRGTLPPLIGTQTIVMNLGDSLPLQVDDSGLPPHMGAQDSPDAGGPPDAVVAPRAHGALPGASPGAEPATQPGADAPQVIAHMKPCEPPRVNTLKHTPKTATTAGELLTEIQSRTLKLDVSLLSLPKGYGYVFAVEAKHSRGACGNVGDWSAPIYSKLVDFEHAPRQLNLEVDARFGGLLFKGQARAAPRPTDEQLLLEAPAVSFADEHRGLPRAMPLAPGGDPWPLGGAAGAYLVRSKDRSVYAERLERDGGAPDASGLPEARPRGDDLRCG